MGCLSFFPFFFLSDSQINRRKREKQGRGDVLFFGIERIKLREETHVKAPLGCLCLEFVTASSVPLLIFGGHFPGESNCFVSMGIWRYPKIKEYLCDRSWRRIILLVHQIVKDADRVLFLTELEYLCPGSLLPEKISQRNRIYSFHSALSLFNEYCILYISLFLNQKLGAGLSFFFFLPSFLSRVFFHSFYLSPFQNLNPSRK